MNGKTDWLDCSAFIFGANHRGLVIHRIRLLFKHRHAYPRGAGRAQYVLPLGGYIEELRNMGPGPVILPETVGGGILGEPMDWWGKTPVVALGEEPSGDEVSP